MGSREPKSCIETIIAVVLLLFHSPSVKHPVHHACQQHDLTSEFKPPTDTVSRRLAVALRPPAKTRSSKRLHVDATPSGKPTTTTSTLRDRTSGASYAAHVNLNVHDMYHTSFRSFMNREIVVHTSRIPPICTTAHKAMQEKLILSTARCLKTHIRGAYAHEKTYIHNVRKCSELLPLPSRRFATFHDNGSRSCPPPPANEKHSSSGQTLSFTN